MKEMNPVVDQFQIKLQSGSSLLVSFGNIIDLALNERVLLLHNAMMQSRFEGFVAIVPA